MRYSLSVGILVGLWSAVTLAPVALAQEQDYMNYHSCDFTEGIPADYALYDVDGQTLHYTMVQGGIKQGEAWARKKESGANNYYAVSACRYKEEEGVTLKPSDDWMVLPAVWVRGRDAALSWRGMSVMNRLDVGAGYEILVSTTGNTPADFTEPAIFSITEESLSQWSEHSVDLSAYEGQHIYIAFHNNSAQGEMLAIDDVVVSGHKGVCDFAVTTGEYSYGTESLDVNVRITSYSEEPLTDMTLYYRHNDETFTEVLTGLSIAKYESYDFTFATPIAAAYADTVRYAVGAVVNGVAQDEIVCATMMYLFKPTRKIVVEEGTGLWCTYCPAGIVAMEILEEKYPDSFIGAALHFNDALGVDNYVYDLGFDGFPTAFVNRSYYVEYPVVLIEDEKKYVTTDGGLETYFVRAMEEVTPVEVSIEGVAVKDGNMTVETSVRTAMDINLTQYQLLYVIIENNIEGYSQANGYAGKDAAIGGWESLPGSVTDHPCQHVVRYMYDGYQGVLGSLPDGLQCGEVYKSAQTFAMPDNILDINEVDVVVMVVDMTTGEVMNAAKMSATAGVDVLAADEWAVCYATRGEVRVELASNAEARVSVYNVSGAFVGACQAVGTAQVRVDAAGVYMVTVEQEGVVRTYKVRL